MRGVAVLLLSLLSFGCGTNLVRPFDIEILGLSARAETLVVKLVPGGEQTCGGLTVDTAPEVDAPIQDTWVRASGAPRSMQFAQMETDALTVIAHAANAAGQNIQFACRQLTIEEVAQLPFGVLILNMSRRTE